MCAQLAASTMWWVGMRKTVSETGYLEDGLHCMVMVCVGGGGPGAAAVGDVEV
jgi:hypothetical protein